MRLFFLIFCLTPVLVFSQNKDFDKLEMLYDQGHYKKVLRRVNKLAAKPEYQKSILPNYYKSLAMMQLYRNDKYRKRNPRALDEGSNLFLLLRKQDAQGKVFAAHAYEVQSLKRDYDYFLEELKTDTKKNQKLIASVESVYARVFEGVQEIQDVQISKPGTTPVISNAKGVRRDILDVAHKHIGTPYNFGGTSPKGFDCSGFVGYVFAQNNIQLPRTSRDQQNDAKKLKSTEVQAGDLVFFANGANVNHVGIIVENANGKITMIHASSSQGIVVTEITSSNYWNKRIHSYGTFIN
jgi:cell wall-associated NlpC family hydrolase